jgi:hypothetical protein
MVVVVIRVDAQRIWLCIGYEGADLDLLFCGFRSYPLGSSVSRTCESLYTLAFDCRTTRVFEYTSKLNQFRYHDDSLRTLVILQADLPPC